MERGVCAAATLLWFLALLIGSNATGRGNWHRNAEDQPIEKSITCYQCNSQYDPRCGDPFDSYTLGTVNCSTKPRLEHLPHLTPTICRKTVQRVQGKVRVVRGCGYLSDHREDKQCLKRSGTHEVHVSYCSCTTDLCNAGPIGNRPSIQLTALANTIIALPALLITRLQLA